MSDQTPEGPRTLPDATTRPQYVSADVGRLSPRTKACYGISALGGGLVEFSLTLYMF